MHQSRSLRFPRNKRGSKSTRGRTRERRRFFERHDRRRWRRCMRRRMRRSEPGTGRSARPRERLIRGKQERDCADRRDKRPVRTILHDTHHFVGCRAAPPDETLGRASRARKRIINYWLRNNLNGELGFILRRPGRRDGDPTAGRIRPVPSPTPIVRGRARRSGWFRPDCG